MSNQLIKTTKQGKEKVFPRTKIQDLFDDISGQKLIDILRSFNMMFVPYLGNKPYTRNQISPELRRQGLWLTYVIDNTVYTEWYDEVAIDDTNWGSDSNWRQGSNTLVGDLSVSPNGTWVINGEDSGITIKGDKGDSPVIRIYNNKIQVSYDKGITYEDLNNTPIYTTFRTNDNRLQVSTDLGTTWENCSEPIAAWFRWADADGTGNVGKVQISRDQQNWEDLSPVMTNNLYIKGYVSTIGNLPSNAAIGDIYMVGPTYDESDTTQNYPHYRMWVKQSSGWVDNGEFTNAGPVGTANIINEAVTTNKLSPDIQSLIANISKNASFAGIATPATNPGTPDGPVFYLATQAGTYSNFNNIEIVKGESAILNWNNSTWEKSSFKSMTDFNSVFDDNGNSLTHKLNTLDSNISELDGKTKDLYTLEEDSFIITDKNGNKIAFFDKDGLHVTSIKVLKDDSLIDILNVIANKVDKIDGKQLSTEDFTTELKRKLENLNDKDILDDYDGLCIVDGNGYKVFEIDAHGNIRMNKNINGALSGKSLYTLCDSLGTAGHWQKKLCDITGMVFDNNINVDKAHPLSAGGTKTSVSGMGTFTRAKNLVEYWKGSQGKSIDVLIIENINDMNDAGGHGDINDSAWCLTQQIVLDNVQSNSGAAESYFNNNVSSIVDGVTKKFGTTIRVPYSSGTAYRLQVTSKASQNGNITITIGSDVFIVGVNTEDSLADIAFKIAEYDFTNAGYSVYQDSETSVILTRTSSTQSVVVNTNSTGVVVSNNTTTGVSYLDYCYIGSTLDSPEWSKLGNWMEQVTWSPISVVSLWARYKGLFDYLCKNLPDTKIFFMIAPRMSDAIANTYKKTDGTYDVKAWMDANNSSTLAVREIQKQVAKMYNIPVLDMWEEANFTLANAEYNYAGGSGVHPGINGYNRIGESVARLINY